MLKRTSRQLIRLKSSSSKITRTFGRPLSFVPKALDPCRNLPEIEGKAEDQIREEVEAIKIGMVERMKQDAQRKKLAVAGDDYFTVAFESGEQAMAFLKAVGYPWPGEAFIDGTILAKAMNIALPKAQKIHPIKSMHANQLTRLISNPKWNIPNKSGA